MTGPPPGSSARQDAPSDRRLDLATLRAEAEDLGRARRAEAFRRLALMADVRECLSEDSPAKARDISAFCDEAFEKLTGDGDGDGDGDAGGAELAPAWVLGESSARWGDYLRLIDPEADADGYAGWAGPEAPPDPRPGPDADRDDAPPAIDPGALFRMLTGEARGPAPDATGWAVSPLVFLDPLPAPPPLSGSWPSADAAPLPGPADSDPFPDPDHAPSAARARRGFEVPAPPLTLAIDQDMRETFLVEASDLYDRVEALVLSLGRGRQEADTLNELGRCFHTLKGAAGSVGLLQLAALIHAMEEQLDVASGEATDTLIDLLHRLLHYLEGVFIALRRGTPGPPEPPRPPAPHPRPSRGPSDETHPASAAEPPAAAPGRAAEGPAGEGPVRVPAERVDELMDLASELITRRGLWAAQAGTMKQFATLARASRNRLLGTIDRLRDLRTDRSLAPSAADGPRGALGRDADLPELVRRLAEQAEDLVVLTDAAQATAAPLSDNSDALARLSLQLWESLQAIRIVPVRGLFQRLARVAHDAARVEGRHVEVVMVGDETGVDRAVQDKAFEPLLHVVRNAVCHGIETPDERRRAGKAVSGRVTLEAARAGNTLVISVRDDGRGLDYAAIASKGRRLGLIAPGDAPTVERLNALVFQSGFSTREEANAIAGRGVGMDVVSQEVGRLHGSVSLASRPGEGTRLSLSLPARLALQQAMILRVDGQAFALPVELIDLAQPFDPAEVDTGGPHPAVRIRDRWVPMTSSREALGLSPSSAVSCPKLLLIQADGGPVALLADAIDGTSELVVKPLGPLLAGHPLVSGTSLSVTGEVIFTLNPAGLARWPREGRGSAGDAPPAPDARPGPRAAPILVVDDSISVRKVVARDLRAMGHEVEEVSDGLEALGKIRSQTYGLVLSDLEMPRMDGFELLAELNRLEITPGLPVVVASTRSDPETRRRVLALGGRDFLPKPIAPDALAALVLGLFPGHTPAAPAAAAAAAATGTFDREAT